MTSPGHVSNLKKYIPDCVACGHAIGFYMHQAYDRDEEVMRYWHPECCPSCRLRTEES